MHVDIHALSYGRGKISSVMIMAPRDSSPPLSSRSRPAYYADVAVVLLLLAISHADAFVTGGAVAAVSASTCCQSKGTTASSWSSTCVVHTSGLLECCCHDHNKLGWDSRLASTNNKADGSISDVSNISGSSNRSSSGEPGTTSTWANPELLPLSNEQQVTQATGAVWKALADGKSRQILRLSLPLIGATEMDDWPGGDRQRYKACGPMVESILLGSPSAEGSRVVEQILDESDAVGLMQLQCKEPKDDASAMIFPTIDTLSLQQQVTNSAGSRLVALVNPAWKSTSDFGFFGAKEADKVLSEFDLTYSLQSLVVYGYTLRLLYCYPGPWRLFLVGEDTGTRELLGSWEGFPPNEEVEQAVFDKKGRPSATERVRASSKLFQDGM